MAHKIRMTVNTEQDDLDFAAEVSATMARTHRVASALRTLERGWDWEGSHGNRTTKSLREVMDDAKVEVLNWRLDRAEAAAEDLF